MVRIMINRKPLSNLKFKIKIWAEVGEQNCILITATVAMMVKTTPRRRPALRVEPLTVLLSSIKVTFKILPRTLIGSLSLMAARIHNSPSAATNMQFSCVSVARRNNLFPLLSKPHTACLLIVLQISRSWLTLKGPFSIVTASSRALTLIWQRTGVGPQRHYSQHAPRFLLFVQANPHCLGRKALMRLQYFQTRDGPVQPDEKSHRINRRWVPGVGSQLA